MMKFHLNIFCFISIACAVHGQSWQPTGNAIHGEYRYDRVGSSFDMNDKGDRIIVGYSNFAYRKVKAFQYQNGSWDQIGDTLKETEMDSQFGFSMAMNGSGNMIGISAYNSNKNGKESGKTKIYQYQENWNEVGSVEGSNVGDGSGRMIASNKKGNVFAIGQQNSPGCSEGYVCPKIKVFENKGAEWKQKGNILSANIGVFRHDFSLDSSGNTIALINHVRDKDEHPLICIDVYTFKKQAWTKAGKSILIKNNHAGNNANISLSGNGKYLIVGMPNFDSNDLVVSGQVKVYKIADNASIQLGENLDGEKKYDYFGSSVDINDQGNVIAVGTSRKKDGYIKIFRNENGKWIQVGDKLKGSNAKLNGKGDIVVVGNPFENDDEGIIQSYIFR